MAFMLSRGASVGKAKGAAAWSSLINACHANGRPAAAEFLAERAEMLDLEAAAGVGRLDIVKSFFNADGSLKPTATMAQMRDGFTWACEYGRTNVVEFLLDHGIEVGAQLPRPHGQTGLHWAAYGAHVDTVRVLLKRHAAVDVKDQTFGTTPLGWALHAWRSDRAEGAPRDSYHQVVALLVAAGATVKPEWLADEKIRADPRIRAALTGERPEA